MGLPVLQPQTVDLQKGAMQRNRRRAARRPGHRALAVGDQVVTPRGVERAAEAEVGERTGAGYVSWRAAELVMLRSGVVERPLLQN
eukprot:7447591-Pyramimonas_sp.AAC.1